MLQLLLDFLDQEIDVRHRQAGALKFFATFVSDGEPKILLSGVFRLQESNGQSGTEILRVLGDRGLNCVQRFPVSQLLHLLISQCPCAIEGLLID